MDNEVINLYINSLKKSTIDEKYTNFLGSLDSTEQEAYLYIEAQRSNQFLHELALTKGFDLYINDLKEEENLKKIRSILHNKQYIQNLIQFWDIFGNAPKPHKHLIENIIEKHKLYIRELASNEIEFYLNFTDENK